MESSVFEGFLLVNKPTGVTSSYCVQYIKQQLSWRAKIGHAGTLDMYATGLLIIAINRTATKHIELFSRLDKWYIAKGKLGQLTNTLDINGVVVQEQSATGITHKNLEDAITSFGKSYLQKPPLFSALKHEGRRLSELARLNMKASDELAHIVKSKEKEVQLYSLELMSYEPPFFTVKAHVSHGTYMRSLLNDIAQKVNSYATTHALQRMQIGPFKVEDAVDLYTLETQNDIRNHCISIEQMLTKIAAYSV